MPLTTTTLPRPHGRFYDTVAWEARCSCGRVLLAVAYDPYGTLCARLVRAGRLASGHDFATCPVCSLPGWRAALRRGQARRAPDGRPADHRDLTCSDCGRQWDLEPTAPGDPEPLHAREVSRPVVQGVVANAGSTHAVLTGERLDVGTLEVLVDGEPAVVEHRSEGLVRVRLTPGRRAGEFVVRNEFGEAGADRPGRSLTGRGRTRLETDGP